MDTTVERLGHIDVLINNAGAGPARLPVHELPVEVWDHAMNVNLRGLFLCTKYALPSMLERDNGCIINIASVSGIIGPPNFSDYAASKRGVMGFTKTLVAEYLLRGIRAHVILPGGTVSQMQREASPNADPATLIQPEDIADAAVFLATQPASAHAMEIVVNKGLQTRYLDDWTR